LYRSTLLKFSILSFTGLLFPSMATFILNGIENLLVFTAFARHYLRHLG
jgi:hypothetical protein